jgi:hypothetical protein
VRHLRQESEAMAVGPAFERVVVRPVVEEENQRWPEVEREQRRRRSARDEARRARQNATIDGLTIGAPLTAAFVGMLLADGYAAADPAGASQAVAPARDGPHGMMPDTLAAGAAVVDAPVQGVEAEGVVGGPDASAGAFQPSPSDIHIAENWGGASPAALDVPDEASAGAGGKAAASAGPEFNFTFLGFGGAGSGLASDDLAVAGNGHSIGRFVVGGDGDDVMVGTEYDDQLYGGAGNDIIYGSRRG